MLEKNYFVNPENSLRETLLHMKRLEEIAVNNFQFKLFVQNNFYSLRNCVDCLCTKLWRFVKENFCYENDVPDELIQAPYVLLKTLKGDCDDFSLFIKSVLRLCGVPANYFLMGRTDEGYTHITVIANEMLLDGANSRFNFIKPEYKYFAIVQ